jgi:hypothetical protein
MPLLIDWLLSKGYTTQLDEYEAAVKWLDSERRTVRPVTKDPMMVEVTVLVRI